ncbi:MAG: tRNA uridine-5-carboxymethylaminomethyl(34) synthesis GTPase MnmE [Myxococcaceae bacterium]|nr:tRNA uridine-5-carboxymethylaminomethyl(34) synthesis GTPase MnmE [Myxococcaceae bacterium]MBH2005966.1 tRNA uridine-5-carboxymethylaminomethyl(34) synthesis GTPase MnmE [Myxococcaceae bacterium]
MRDTICALATSPGQSALAIVRVSGPDSVRIREAVFTPKYGKQADFKAIRGDVLDFDDAVCISFPEGKSFTGEASFELSLHGSSLIIQQTLHALQKAGARLARPGEFSMRAFLSGKLDLTQAEAVCDLISARSEEAARVALRNLKGGLAQVLEPARIQIIDALCEIEARLDFPDEDIGSAVRQSLQLALEQVVTDLSSLIANAQLGKRLMQGARVVLYGAPNAGKSTLLNTLLGEEKALVHEKPGTTRDVIEAEWVLNGIPVRMIDVAGIRVDQGLDPVEQLGIERARKELQSADLVLWLKPQGDCSLEEPEMNVPLLTIASKSDLGLRCENCEQALSAKTGWGIESLKEKLFDFLAGPSRDPENTILTRARQVEEVQTAKEALEEALWALKNREPDEVVAFELRSAGHALDRLLGKSLNEEVLDLIFSRFCIGK